MSAEDDLLLMVAPPWASDANGRDVPTRYEIEGSNVTQVVEHDGSYAYPIVADPWLGVQLFTGFYTGRWNGDITYNGNVSTQARAVFASMGIVFGPGGGVAGEITFRAVMNDNGWKEWVARWPSITKKATVKQQFQCHVAAGFLGLPLTGTYNLERARVNRSNWGSYVLNHQCNWRYATGGAKS